MANEEHRGSYGGYDYMRDESALERAEEREMLKKFIEKEILKGQFIEQFPLYNKDRIDALCVKDVKEGRIINKIPIFLPASAEKYDLSIIARGNKGDIIWIIEVKSKRGDVKHALGQVLIYTDLFSKMYPQYILKKAILCTGTKEEYKEICKKFDVEVFVV